MRLASHRHDTLSIRLFFYFDIMLTTFMTRAGEKREEQMSVRERLLNSAATCAQFPQENEKESLSLSLTRRLNAADTFSLSDREMHPLSAPFRNKPTLINILERSACLKLNLGIVKDTLLSSLFALHVYWQMTLTKYI